ncbi:hypothetical protein CSA17_06485 [bacterium DOLJORAL78_65_58]|nr:MAG: hypothetical protein CSA17_06485 [bacterium DOLJORAL78_65_58]
MAASTPDLKTGSGAFMRDLDKARELARLLVATGRRYGRRMSVVFSDMDQPLGVAVGHANETIEALDALRPGRRTTAPQDLVTLTEDLVAEMVRVSGLCPDRRQSLQRVREVWDSGRALRRALDWVAAQDGRLDPDRADFGLEVAPLAVELQAPRDGWLAGVDCRQVGLALADMGGARRRVEDPLDLSCGIDWLPQVGDAVAQGQPLARVYCARKDQARVAVKRLEAALRLSETEVPAHELIMGRVE